MDAGYHIHLHHENITKTFSQAVETGLAADSIESETLPKIITIFDHLFNSLTKYLEGDNFQTSLGTCVYNLIDTPDEHPAQATYGFNFTKGFKMLAFLATEIINQAQIFEEEDFVPNLEIFTHKVNFDKQWDTLEALKNDVMDLPENSEEDGEMKAAIQLRIKLFLYMMQTFQLMHAYICQQGTINNDFLRTLLNTCIEIRTICDTLKRAKHLSYPQVKIDLQTRTQVYGFDKLMCYDNMQGGYPKAPMETTQNYPYDWIIRMTYSCMAMVQISTQSKLYLIQSHGWSLARMKPNLVIRSAMALILSLRLTYMNDLDVNADKFLQPNYEQIYEEHDKSQPLKKLCLDNIFYVSCKARNFYERNFGSENFKQWFGDYIITIDRYLPAICETPCRQIFTILQAIERFSTLKASSVVLDQEIASIKVAKKKTPFLQIKDFFFNFASLEQILASVKYLLLGFELEIYSLKELSMICFVILHKLDEGVTLIDEFRPGFLILLRIFKI